MAEAKVKPEGGSGGKLGHSNMTHWMPTAEVKRAARKARRKIGKKLAEGVDGSPEGLVESQ